MTSSSLFYFLCRKTFLQIVHYLQKVWVSKFWWFNAFLFISPHLVLTARLIFPEHRCRGLFLLWCHGNLRCSEKSILNSSGYPCNQDNVAVELNQFLNSCGFFCKMLRFSFWLSWDFMIREDHETLWMKVSVPYKESIDNDGQFSFSRKQFCVSHTLARSSSLQLVKVCQLNFFARLL